MRNVHIGIFVAAAGGLFTLQQKTVYYLNKKIWNDWTDAIVFFTCVCFVYTCPYLCMCAHVGTCTCMHNACGGQRQRSNIRYLPLSFFIYFFLKTGAHQPSRRAGHWAKGILYSSLPPSFWQGCWTRTRVLVCCTAGTTSLALWSLLLSDSMSRLMTLDLKTSNPMLIYGKTKI